MAFSFPVMGDLCRGTDPGRGRGMDKRASREFYAAGSSLPAAPWADTRRALSGYLWPCGGTISPLLPPLFAAERLSPSARERVPAEKTVYRARNEAAPFYYTLWFGREEPTHESYPPSMDAVERRRKNPVNLRLVN
jgi:hypothetical protein